MPNLASLRNVVFFFCPPHTSSMNSKNFNLLPFLCLQKKNKFIWFFSKPIKVGAGLTMLCVRNLDINFEGSEIISFMGGLITAMGNLGYLINIAWSHILHKTITFFRRRCHSFGFSYKIMWYTPRRWDWLMNAYHCIFHEIKNLIGMGKHYENTAINYVLRIFKLHLIGNIYCCWMLVFMSHHVLK